MLGSNLDTRLKLRDPTSVARRPPKADSFIDLNAEVGKRIRWMDLTQAVLPYFILVMPPEKIAIFIWSSFFSLFVFLAFIPLSIQ